MSARSSITALTVAAIQAVRYKPDMRPPRHEVVDLTHRIGPDAERILPRLRDFYVDLAMSGTAAPAGQTITSPLPCRFRPGHRLCGGTLVLHRSDVPAGIGWQCNSCEAGGTLNEFQGTEWDVARTRKEQAEGDGLLLKYPAIFHGSLCDAVRENAALRVFVHSGQLVEDRVVTRITRDQLEALHSLLQERLARRTALHGRKLRFVFGAVAILRSKGETVAQGGDPGAS